MRDTDSFRCPVCDAARTHERVAVKNGHAIWRCTGCGVGRARVDDFDPAAHYDTGFFSGAHPTGYVDYAGSEPVVRAEFRRLVDHLARHGATGGRLLDVGCAYGFFLKEAAPRFEAHGVDVSAAAIAACRASGLDRAYQGEVTEELAARIGPLDAATMLDVIEHLEDPEPTLAALSRAVKPGGVVVLTTGDWGALFARLSGARWRHLIPPIHLWFYTPGALIKLFDRYGFEAVETAHPWKFVPVSLVLFMLARFAGIRAPRFPAALSTTGVWLSLFDIVRVTFRKR